MTHLLFACLFYVSPARADDLGRLFTLPQERARWERARHEGATSAPLDQESEFHGFIKRRGSPKSIRISDGDESESAIRGVAKHSSAQ